MLSGFKLTERPEDHPVVYVSWEDAQGFCKWLSEKEGKSYRLPTDREWSVAVGLGRKEKWRMGDTVESVDKDPDEFPWGRSWPPPQGAGNYSDQSHKAKAPSPSAQYIDGYDDGFPTTSPAKSFASNEVGLYDLGGNALEWLEDSWNGANTHRVVRGGSWYYFLGSGTLLSSYRQPFEPSRRTSFVGFRVVVVVAAGE